MYHDFFGGVPSGIYLQDNYLPIRLHGSTLPCTHVCRYLYVHSRAYSYTRTCARVDVKHVEKTWVWFKTRADWRNTTDIRNVRSANEAIDSHIRRAPAINNSPGPINAIVQRRVTKARPCECVSVRMAACARLRRTIILVASHTCIYRIWVNKGEGRGRGRVEGETFQSEGETHSRTGAPTSCPAS